MATILNHLLAFLKEFSSTNLTAAFLWLATAVLMLLITSTRSRGAKKQTLPPSPPGLPIIGNLHQLGRLPHRALRDIARKHGPVVYLRLGLARAVVATSPEAASQFLKTHDANFASRPPSDAGEFISYGSRDITFCEYGSHWRNIKKFCTMKLLSAHKIDSFSWLRKEELIHLVQSIRDSASRREAVDVASALASFSTNMMCRMIFGERFEDDSMLKTAVKETMATSGAFNVSDFFPFVGRLDLHGLRQRMKKVNRMFDDIFERVIEERLRSTTTQQQQNFMDILLATLADAEGDIPLDRVAMKAILLDMFVGAIDTGSVMIEWILAELMKKPLLMRKLQEEIERAIGLERMVDESDLSKLGYLDMVIKEGFRLHPPAPLLAPHLAMKDSVIMGYDILKNTRVIVNAWAIGRDPESWTDPEEFIPERFTDLNVDIGGTDFKIIPFGSGRRRCPGMHLGAAVVQLVMAQLVHCFDWELPNGMPPEDLDMEEEFGLTVPRKNSLVAVPTYRLLGDAV
ncbi:Premnaspirodiene oxygenase [Acorus gramineus]|uniref:Premnaspirodiene oxygenase n=1 Tax=Acorus gramineus TaxID=55184 RepID=A0AAV9BJM5_ACOGR|nr:Premnaspirodiene oxygenase [Acorus gramineus]